MNRTPSANLLNSYANVEEQSNVNYSEQIRLREIEKLKQTKIWNQRCDGALNIIGWGFASLLFGLEAYDKYIETFAMKLMKGLYDFVKIPTCSIEAVPGIRRVFDQPRDFDVISKPTAQVDNITTGTSKKDRNCCLKKFYKKVVTMEDVVKAIHQTNKNVVEGFAYLGNQSGKMSSRLARQEKILLLICKHLNLEINESDLKSDSEEE